MAHVRARTHTEPSDLALNRRSGLVDHTQPRPVCGGWGLWWVGLVEAAASYRSTALKDKNLMLSNKDQVLLKLDPRQDKMLLHHNEALNNKKENKETFI